MSNFFKFLADLAALVLFLFLIFCLVYFGLPIVDLLFTYLRNGVIEILFYFEDWWSGKA